MFRRVGRRFFPRRPNHSAVVAYLALFLALGGGALAATSGFVGSDGQIHGCTDAKGALSLLKAPATRCGARKTAIAWNQKGPRGLEGLRGPQGTQGIQGAQGLQGLKGGTGAQGIQGIQGPTGDPGPGATSIPITNYPLNSSDVIMTIHGIDILYQCDPGVVGLHLVGHSAGQVVYVSGVKAANSTLSAVNESDPYGIGFFAGASGTANVDVIATVDGTWVRFDLGGFYGGANGCNIWGLVIPGT